MIFKDFQPHFETTLKANKVTFNQKVTLSADSRDEIAKRCQAFFSPLAEKGLAPFG